MTTFIRFAVLLFVWPCFAQTAQMDVNDVSILLPPIDSSSVLSQYLGIDFQTNSGPLLTSTDFANLLVFSNALNDNPQYGAQDPSLWKLFAVRFDPCTMENPPQDICHVELRLIFQPVEPAPLVGVQDSAMHLIYELPAASASDLVSAFITLKANNPDVTVNGVALGIHPAIVKQGMTGSFVNGLYALIGRFAGQAFLRDATVTLQVGADDWRFTKATMTNGQLAHVSVPFSPSLNMTLFSDANTAEAAIQPNSLATDNLNAMVDSIGNPQTAVNQRGQFWNLPATEQDADVQMALRIENPKLNGATSTDCVSCHQATRALVRVKGFSFLSAQDGQANRFPWPAGITSTFAGGYFENYLTYTVRAFGYSNANSTPVYTQATLNSSADVADRINKGGTAAAKSRQGGGPPRIHGAGT